MKKQHGSPQQHSPDQLQRLRRVGIPLEALNLYSLVQQRTGNPIADRGQIEGALVDVRDQLLKITAVDSTVHGWRAQALFEAMVASLGEVRLLKLEDAGDVFFKGEQIKVPDFRIITSDEEQMLVEVKNFYQKRLTDPYKVRPDYLQALEHYANMVGVTRLKFAIYWTCFNLWTLTSSGRFTADDSGHLSLPLPEAMKANEMGSLGDRVVATEWPIGLTFYSDPDKPREVSDDGRVLFTIGRVEHRVAGRVVTRPNEQHILWRLMLYGGWEEETPVEIVDGKLVSVSFLFSPTEASELVSQPFAMHAPLSSIYSKMFNDVTLGDQGEVTGLRIDIDPGALAALIPDDYKGEVFRVWRFHQEPSEPDVD